MKYFSATAINLYLSLRGICLFLLPLLNYNRRNIYKSYFHGEYMTNLINKLKIGALTLALAGSLGGCGDHKKYQDFANFIKENGEFSEVKTYTLNFLINDQKYMCSYYGYSSSGSLLSIMRSNGESMEHFQDWNLDGLDRCSFRFGGDYIEDNSSFKLEKNKQKYERLIENIPKLYNESKNKK